MNLSALSHNQATLNRLLELLEQYGGPTLAVVFFLFMAYVFYWAIVLLPRRVRKIYSALRYQGYTEMNAADPEVQQALSSIAPIYVHTPRKDYPIPEWTVHNACALANADMTRYVIDVSRSQVDLPGVSNNTSLRDSTVILEERSLGFSEEVHLAPKKDACFVEWNSRFGLTEVQEGLKHEFSEQYKLFTPSGKLEQFSSELQDVLVKTSGYFVEKAIRVTFRFQKNGWGMSTGMRSYKLKDMETLLEIAGRISAALG